MSVKRYDVMSYSLDADGNSGPFVKYDDYAALEARCAALAAENAGLKESRKNLAEFIHEELDADYPLNMDIKTTATDAFLAELRAQGVEMFADDLLCPDLDSTIREFAEQLRKGVQS
ncbi:hypothetical protein V5031_23950 [Enterobacter kobei]|uniref:hypothetical protein n=1 Tax=Enterobacter kobei TaxID=208224 RepID=UPI002FD1DE50